VFATTAWLVGPIGAALAWETAAAAACALGVFASFVLGRRGARLLARDERVVLESRLRVQRNQVHISSSLGRALSRSAAFEAVARAAADALDGEAAAVLIPAAGRLETAAAHELPATVTQLLDETEPGASEGFDHIAVQQTVLAASSVATDDRLPAEWRTGLPAHGYAALLAISVDEPRSAMRAFVLVLFRSGRAFTEDDVEVARYLGEAAGDALWRGDAFDGERSGRATAEQLTRAGRLLASELDPAAVLDEVVERAPSLVNADACTIRLVEGEELVVAAAEGPGAERVEGFRSSALGRLCGDVVQSGAPLSLPGAGHDARLRGLDPMLEAGHVSYLGVPLDGPEGTPLGVLAVYAAVAHVWAGDEIEALQALAASTSAALANAGLYQAIALEKERGAAILASIADGIVAVDGEGDVVLWNAAAERVTGIAAEGALGFKPAELLRRTLESPEDAPPGERLLSITRDGEEVWLALRETVMRDPAGRVSGRVFAFRDISADRLVEQVKTDFVSTVSHELRTPLTSIYGFAETLLRQDVDFSGEERDTFLGYIASESQRLTAIVDSLLNVARLDTGDLEVHLAPTDVRIVARRVVESFPTPGSNGHRLVVDLPEAPLAATADPDKLQQVLSILLDNALRYSPAGGVVTLGAARRRDVVEMSVADEGIGIPQADHEQIFRKFYRGTDATLRTGPGGTGLGLFIARGLVTAMGGRIWVTSSEGGGARFAFELPAAATRE
jgi:two-component system, OmpR family, phosphate regulon sensor histidine kinase PhoR